MSFLPVVQRLRGFVRSVGLSRFAFLLAASLGCLTAQAQNVQVSSYTESDDPVIQGAQYSYTALVANGDLANPATGVVVTLTIPSGTTFVSASYGPGSTACAAPVGSNVSCSIGTVPAAADSVATGAVEVVLILVADTPPQVTSTVTVASDLDTNAGDNSLSQTTTIVTGADLTVTSLSANPSPVNGGQTIVYTVVPNNAGPSTAALPRLVVTLPANVSYVTNSATGSGWSCSASGQVITCDRASAAVGDMPAVTVSGVVNIGTGNITATAVMNSSRSGATADPNPDNNTASVTTAVNPGADVRAVSKTASPSPGVGGQNVTFTLTVRNDGPSSASSIVVTDALPSGWTYVSSTASGYSCANASNTVTCTRTAAMTSGTQETLTIVALAPTDVAATGTNYTNTFSVTSSTPDPTSGNNSASVGINVLPDGTDLRIYTASKQPTNALSSSDPVAVGSTLDYAIVLRNNGPRAATGSVQLSIVLPSEESFVAGSVGSNWSCAANAQNLLCTYTGNSGTLGVNANTSALTFRTTALAGGTLVSQMCTGGSTPTSGDATAEPTNGFNNLDPNPTNDCTSSSAVSTTALADLTLTKTTSTPTGGDKVLTVGESTVTYTLVVTNNGPDAATGVVVADTSIPGNRTGTVLTVTQPAGFTCNLAVRCTQNNGDTLASGESRTFIITAERALNDTWTTATPRVAASSTNTATVDSTDIGDPARTNNSASDTVQIDPIADVAIASNTIDQNPVNAGVNVTYTIAFRNNGPSRAENVIVTSVFDRTDFTFVSATRTPGNVSCTFNGTDTVTCPAVAQMTENEQESITLVIRPNYASGEPSRTFTNTATVSTTTTESTSANNTLASTLTVVTSNVDLLINKSDSPAVQVGLGPDPLGYDPGTPANNVITYRTRASNLGPSLATGVVITDTYTPSQAARSYTFLGVATTIGGTYSDTGCTGATVGSVGTSAAPLTIACNIGNIANNANSDLFWKFRIDTSPLGGGETYSNSASVASNETETNSGNNTATEQTTIRTRADVQVTKSVSQSPVNLREPFTWNIAVTNNGPGTAENVVVSDTVATGIGITGTVTYSGAASGNCSVASQAVTCSVGAIASGQTVNIVVPVRVNTYAASYSNTANATTDSVDPVASNNTSTASVTVVRSSLTGTVFLDRNGNGAIDAGESGVGSVTVRVSGTDAYGNAVSTTATSNASTGVWTISNLSPADATGYTLTETQPAAYVNSLGTPATMTAGGTYARGGLTGNTTYTAITLGSNVAATGYHFPEVRRPSLSGVVYVDSNGNGSYTAGPDTVISGATVRLLDNTGTQVGSTTTNASGAYSFTNLDPLTVYTIEEPLPASPTGLTNGPITPGLINSAACATGCTAQANTPSANTDRIAAIDLSAGYDGTQFNFGELTASIAGSVYADYTAATPANTNNGARDAGEAGIAGVTITLTGTDINSAAVNRTATTDASGNYLFSSVLPGTYTLSEGAIPGSAGSFNDGKETVGSLGGSTATNDQISAIALTAGTQATGYLFGELPVAPISGTVYIDTNRNNAHDGGESPIAGVTLRLYAAGTNCASPGTALASATSQADGSYLFSGMAAGFDYVICETQPAAWANGNANGTAGSNTITITNLGSAGSSSNLFGELPGAIAGTVYLDANNNGALDGGETGIAAVVVTLTGTGVDASTISRTATTDTSGNFRFDDLPAATAAGYVLTEQSAQPSVTVLSTSVTTLNGITTVGTGSGTSTGVNTTPSNINGIAVSAGAIVTGNLFAEVLPVSMSGRVFVDVANDGAFSSGTDSGIAGQTIALTGTDDLGGAVSRNLTTAADGTYSVSDLRPGTYTLTEPNQPAGTANGITTAGSGGGTPTTSTVTPSAISGVVLTTPGTAANNNLFAEIPANGSIAVRVWLDANNNGTIDAGEAGIANVTVNLSGTLANGSTMTASTVTDANGNASFTGLAQGSYVLTEPTQPAGTLNGRTLAGTASGTATTPGIAPSAVTAIALAANQSASGYLFGEIPPATISGRVFDDMANDGAFNPPVDIGFAGNAIVLTGTNDLGAAVNVTTTTATDGTFSFIDLRPGTYTLTQPTQPLGRVNGVTTAGTIAGASSGSATGVNTLPSAISSIAVTAPGQTSINNLFAEIPAASTISGRVWLDLDNNGLIGSGESGIAGQTIVVTGTDAAGTPVSRSTTTDASGHYSFGGLLPGTYTLDQNSQPAGTYNGRAVAGTINGATSGAPSNPDATHSRIANIVLAGVADSINNNFGELPDASLSGSVWYDVGSAAGQRDAGDRGLSGWTVQVIDPVNGAVLGSAVSGTDGGYTIAGLPPARELHLRFREPRSGVVFGYPVSGESGTAPVPCDQTGALAAGTASSCRETSPTSELQVVLQPGQNLGQQSLPVDPSGVVYQSVTRQPVGSAVVTLAPVGSCAGFNPATHILNAGAGGYTISGSSISMTVGADGLYQFYLLPSAPSSCEFSLSVTPPAGSGLSFASTAIPAEKGVLAPAGGAGSTFRVQAQAVPPSGSQATTYYLNLNAGSAAAAVVHNHIPLDPTSGLNNALTLTKTGDKRSVQVGDTLRYTIAVRLNTGATYEQLTIVDRLPPGFSLIRGTAQLNGAALAAQDRNPSPAVGSAGASGPTLAFNLGAISQNQTLTLSYRVRVGAGALEGDATNRATAYACSTGGSAPATCADSTRRFAPVAGALASNEGRYHVDLNGGVFTTDACVLGKIFVDCNHNQVQDSEELGIPGVRLYFQDGSYLISDVEGKYSQCGLLPNSHVLKVDRSTLPRGARLVTSSNRNLGDANSLWLDLKNGELYRADFIEGSCSNTVLEQVKARRAQGEVRAPETEKKGGQPLRFESKPRTWPAQGTDSAHQAIERPREAAPLTTTPVTPSASEIDVPTSALPMNQVAPGARP